MTHTAKIRALLVSANRAADDQAAHEARIAARCAWIDEIVAALKAADRKVADAWARIFESLPDDLDDEELEAIPHPPEQAELDAILAQIEAARDRDLWPRELYWGDV